MAVVVKRGREREGVVLVGVKMPARTVERLDAAAQREDRTRSAFVRIAVETLLAIREREVAAR